MKNLMKPIFVFFIVLVASFKANSQSTDLADYVITGYYANSATATFKTPFLINFGEKNTFHKLDVDGKLHEGKYTFSNGKVTCEYIGGFETYQISGEKVTSSHNRTFALLKKKIFGNQLAGNRYTGILHKQNSKVAVRTSYKFIGLNFTITDENGTVSSFRQYTLVGNMAGFNWNGPGQLRTKIIRNVFVQCENQLIVVNIYANEGSTYGTLDLVSK